MTVIDTIAMNVQTLSDAKENTPNKANDNVNMDLMLTSPDPKTSTTTTMTKRPSPTSEPEDQPEKKKTAVEEAEGESSPPVLAVTAVLVVAKGGAVMEANAVSESTTVVVDKEAKNNGVDPDDSKKEKVNNLETNEGEKVDTVISMDINEVESKQVMEAEKVETTTDASDGDKKIEDDLATSSTVAAAEMQ